jgi:hypothetical protein
MIQPTSEVGMEETKQDLLSRLMDTASALERDRLQEALDFVTSLKGDGPAAVQPPRGSAKAVLRHANTFRLGPGEADRLLSEIEALRALDMTDDA